MPNMKARVVTPANKTPSETDPYGERRGRHKFRTERHDKRSLGTFSTHDQRAINMENETSSCERHQFQKDRKAAHRKLKTQKIASREMYRRA